MTTIRWLTPAAKGAVLREWHHVRAQLPAHTVGGDGFPDESMIPWCEAINEIPGVCTLQSCSGHTYPDGTSDTGHLWLWLAPEMSAAFDLNAHRLAYHGHLIEEVCRRYTSWGQEVTTITFAGDERDSLPQSLRLILAFLRTLRAQTHEGSAK